MLPWLIANRVIAPAAVGTASGLGAVGALAANNSLITFVFPLLVVAVAGVVTIRSNVAKIYKENYEAKVEELKIVMQQRDAEREAKHEAKSIADSFKTQLELESYKRDLTPVTEQLKQQRVLLEQILATLQSRPPTDLGGGV